MVDTIDRRRFLLRTGLLGCSLAASPLVTPVSFASMPGENRLVVILLRGGMDGIDVVRPVADPGFAALRGQTSADTARPLDGRFGLHPALDDLWPLWEREELAFVHAVSTPYRDKRSHFDGQDVLEAGTSGGAGGGTRDGWLNRLLQDFGDARGDTAYAIGNDPLKILSGPAEVTRWAPDADLRLSAQTLDLAQRVMADDPDFAAAFAQAMAEIAPSAQTMTPQRATDKGGKPRDAAETAIARFAATRLRGDTRVASFSLNGWDTHRGQERTLPRSLRGLSAVILTLRDELGDRIWDRTAVLCMTEFGRTARMNGTGGTDHGTGGVMLLAGGAVRGGRVVGQWPGLDEAALYERRDLMPTRDLRAHAGWTMRGLFGLSRGSVESAVFPGVDLGPDPGLIR